MNDLQQLRDKAAADFKDRGFPTTQEELWRFTDVSSLAKKEFSNDWKPADLDFQPLETIVVVFENGKLSREKSNLADLPAGVCIGSVMDRVDPRIGTLADSPSGFVCANTAFFSEGAFIEVADGVGLETPIHLVYLADLDGAAFHLRNFVSCGKNASVTVVEEYIGMPGTTYWSNSVTEAFVDENGAVDHYKIQRESTQAYHFQTLEVSQQAGSRFTNHAVTFGSQLGRDDIRCKLRGAAVSSVCNGLYLLSGKQHFDTHTLLDHEKPNCTSHELYKGILNQKAHAVFCGRIMVRPDAQQTDAVQSNKNLLLSRGAKVNSLPQLEIYADDVKCTHGATIGELSDDSLFYLQTRGISKEQAQSLLTYAFANEVLDAMQSTAVREQVEELMLVWLESEAGA